ncbi:MAG TPA: tetratricopeptide repeat protein [Burkholderiales bacterium]|nr:tetratricopeptide repeat protein [Burkholderiales bacterium]
MRIPVLGIAVALLAGALAACAGRTVKSSSGNDSADTEDGDATSFFESPERGVVPALPPQDLTETVLYEFLLAEIATQRGDVTLAAQAYVDLAKRTRDPRIARRATEVAMYARMANAAVEAAQIWQETEPQSTRARQALAGLLVNAGRYDEALPHFEKLLAEGAAKPAETFSQLGRALANAQDRKSALKLVRTLAQRYPRVPQAHFAVAQTAAGAGDDELALAEIRQAEQLRPDWENAVLFEAQLLQRKSPDAAAARLETFLKSNPGSREVRLDYARLLVLQKKIAEARGEFQKLLAAYPDNTDVTFAVALLSLQLNDYDAAEANLKRLLRGSYRDKNGVRLYLGQIAEDRKKLPEALRWYDEITDGEHYLAAQIRSAQVLSKQGKLAAARERLHQTEPQNGQQRVQLVLAEAQLLRDANQPKAAFDMVQQALEKLPNQPDLLYDHAMLAEKLDRMDVLESSLRKLIALRPDYAHAYNALGYSLADRNERLPEARDLIEKALKLSPDDSFIIDSMGWVLYRQGQTKDALEWLQKAYAARPDAEIAAHLGEVLWALGRRDAAERVLSDAAQKDPGNEAIANTLKRLKR